MAFGIAPPIPRPVRARNPASASTDCAVAVSNEPTPKISTHPMSTGRRPNWSASGPLTIAPIIMPDEATGDDRAKHTPRDLHGGAERRRDVTHRLRVEPVDEHDERAHRRDHELVPADGALIDELADVECSCWRHRRRIVIHMARTTQLRQLQRHRVTNSQLPTANAQEPLECSGGSSDPPDWKLDLGSWVLSSRWTSDCPRRYTASAHGTLRYVRELRDLRDLRAQGA